MARPGSDKQSLVGTVLTPALGCALSGAGNRTGKVASVMADAARPLVRSHRTYQLSTALACVPSRTIPRSAAFLGLVNQRLSAA